MNAIAAVAANGGIGKDNELLFRISADLKRFKALTSGHTVIMGRKTLQSLPGGRGLPNRRNIVITHDPDFTAERAEAVHSVEEALALADNDAFVIGGESIYRAMLPYCDKVYLTRVYADPEADAFFPALDGFHIAAESELMEENGLCFQYADYVR
ncbi:MAG: dihydrofolate reductase [Eubacteriales bacterium]|nr:dihydrofolate reductase [Eubacteriales bacterium]